MHFTESFYSKSSASLPAISEIGTEDDPDSFFRTALQIQLETAEDTLNRDLGIPEEIPDEKKDAKPSMTSSKFLQLMTGKPIFHITSPPQESTSPDFLNPLLDDRRPSMVDLTKAFTVNKIAKTLVTKQKTRLQKLEETGNFTINVPLRKFMPGLVKAQVYQILKTHLRHVKYDPRVCRSLSQSLSEEIRDAVKELKFPRYKFVSVVTIGQLENATTRMCSRSLWNSSTDNYACAEFRNRTLYAVAIVFATFLD